jgi:predicted transcriptional regulator
VSDTELEVLKVLWEAEEATVRDLLDRLHEQGRDWAYTTVQTLVVRLCRKGYVETRRQGKAHVFSPCVDQDALLRFELAGLAERVCDGKATPLMMTLVRDNAFTPAELAELRRLLDHLDQG